MSEETYIYECVHTARIQQRGRGVYLAHVTEDENGEESYDAFSTLAAAKRYCAEWFERKILPWEKDSVGWYCALVRVERRQRVGGYETRVLSQRWRKDE